jgi:signal transduction histidine kinase/FixJ family two-component response regulator/HPt (histidine-containing phosphotransfer) domain-containing protein
MKRLKDKSHINFRAVNVFVACVIAGFSLLIGIEFFHTGRTRESILIGMAGCAAVFDILLFLTSPRFSIFSHTVIFLIYVGTCLILKTFAFFFIIYILILCFEGIYLRRRNVVVFTVIANIAILILMVTGKLMAYSKHYDSLLDLYIEWALVLIASVFIHIIISFASAKTKTVAATSDAFDTLLTTTPDIILLLDEKNRVVFASNTFAKFVHADSPDMLIGRPVLDLFDNINTKTIIYDVLESGGYYDAINQIISDGKLMHFRIIANNYPSTTKGTFIHINDVTQIVEDRVKAESAVIAKNNFLANTSHEIRTPMNAILGMSELALRENLSDKAREYVKNIRQAGTNLLAIINDILDFSKMESGRLEINPAPYAFSSLLNDCINIIKIRLADKPVMFIVNVDSNLPEMLVGDEVRVRQIILNLLTNAAKYTGQGHIIFSVTGAWGSESYLRRNQPAQGNPDHPDAKKISLVVSVTDTGIGIKEDDIKKIFTEFTQVDTHKTRNIEGTGLGLAISRNLCRLMGGDISVESAYGEGSTFYAVIPQLASGSTPLASVDNPETKSALVYEPRIEYANSIVYSLLTLNVPVFCPQKLKEFEKELVAYSHNPAGQIPYEYAFVSSQFEEITAELIERHDLKTTPVLLTEIGEITDEERASLGMPAYTVSIANLLNGNAVVETTERTATRFIAPEARLLVVDDIAVNLNVAKGLLAVYQPHIDVCTLGQRAIDLVKKCQYDIIFMDHMMPGMDGIETTEAIRNLDVEYAKTVPIVALTANAVVGMKEMFLERGFDDYLSKPLEITRLNEIMEKWIPPEKRVATYKKIESVNEVKSAYEHFIIDGVDSKLGITFTGGTEAGYRDVLKQFSADADERLPFFESVDENTDFVLFATQAHALKSALAVIGATEISKEAAFLEEAGKTRDIDAIGEMLPRFHERLSRLARDIDGVLAKQKDAVPEKTVTFAKAALAPLFLQLKAALTEKKMRTIDKLIAELEKIPVDETVKESINAISDGVLMSDYDEAIRLIDELLCEN